MDVSCQRPFLPGTSLEPAVIPTVQASSLTLQYFPLLLLLLLLLLLKDVPFFCQADFVKAFYLQVPGYKIVWCKDVFNSCLHKFIRVPSINYRLLFVSRHPEKVGNVSVET